MKRILLICSAIFVMILKPSYSQAQCSITTDTTAKEFVTFLTKNERLFENEDLENGIKVVFAQSLLVVNKADNNKVKFSILITYIRTSYQPEIVPRQMKFNFQNGQTMSYTADEYDSPKFNGVPGERCIFRIPISDMQFLKVNPISNFTITDNRTNQSLVMTPYAAIFEEQIQCLLKRQGELY